jgi:predicted ester cyclase
MSTASHDSRRVVERYVEIHRTGDVSGLAEIIAPDFRYRAGSPVGVEGVAAQLRTFLAGFTEITCSLERCIAEEDWAAFRFVIGGRHTGVFAGRAPTGRVITWPGADFVRLRDGKFVELWAVQESLHLMEAIGAVAKIAP